MIENIKIYYRLEKKEVRSYYIHIAAFRCALALFVCPVSLVIFLYTLLANLLRSKNSGFNPSMWVYLSIFCFSLLIIVITFLISKRQTEKLFSKNEFMDFQLSYNNHEVSLTNFATNKTITFVLDDIKQLEYSKKVLSITIKNNEIKGLVIFPNLQSIKSILAKGKKYKK